MDILDFKELLILTKKSGASDLHLNTGLKPFLRLNGQLQEVLESPILSQADIENFLIQFLNPDQREKFANLEELDFSIDFPEIARFRVNCFHQRAGISLILRLVPTTILKLEELGLPLSLANFARRPQGLVLVTGATGSGKSTTLAALIDIINEERKAHIITIEDPIEFVHTNKNSIINQREVGSHTKSFSIALRSALREDPNVILVGEMRDLETISMAITAAETGHLVFSTVHTNDCATTLDRIIDIFPSHQQKQIRYQVSLSLYGVVSQKLLPTIDGSRRVCATEVMVNTTAIGNLIRESKTYQIPSIIQTSSKENMHTMDASLKNLLLAGVISKEEAIFHATNKEYIMATGDLPNKNNSKFFNQ